MKLKRLLKGLPIQKIIGSKDIEITGVCADSRLVSPGNLFIAKKGFVSDGAKYISAAIASGAVAVVTDLYDPFLTSIVQVICEDVAGVEAQLAATYYQYDPNALFLVGITGTNGKTTISYLVKHLFDRMERPCGLMGSIERIVGKNVFPSPINTPDVITNYRFFYEMRGCGDKAAVMEVSSHGLDQGRVKGISYDVAIFTNLTLDHLDYHKTMEAYGAAKAKLFESCKLAILNADDPFSAQLKKGPFLTYGIDQCADVRASDIVLGSDGTSFTVQYCDQKVSWKSPLIGRFNVYNMLSVLTLAVSQKISLKEATAVLASFKTAPGRLERVPNPFGLNVFIDYAHTDDALSNVLSTLRELKKGKLITIFGCGGNRDASKRPKMGAVATSMSDVTIVTSDNPRNEDPRQIIDEILVGCKTSPIVEIDRQAAIQKAVALATKEDIVLIAGKGHENYQVLAHQTIDFDDRVHALAAMRQKHA